MNHKEALKTKRQQMTNFLSRGIFHDPIKIPAEGEKTTNELVQEIHDTFYTEVNRLLADARITLPADTNMQNVIDKAERLRMHGFIKAPEVFEAQQESARLTEIQRINNEKSKLHSAIIYFSTKYPQYKFITEDSVKKICKKYGLVYSTVDRYKSTVPDENLMHIEKFKIDGADKCFAYIKIRGFLGKRIEYVSFDEFHKIQEQLRRENRRQLYNMHIETSVFDVFNDSREVEVCKLEIAAPMKDFDLTNAEIENFQVVDKHIPDPVVLQPVFFEGQKHYLIVTAWGLEASDPMVVNEKMN